MRWRNYNAHSGHSVEAQSPFRRLSFLLTSSFSRHTRFPDSKEHHRTPGGLARVFRAKRVHRTDGVLGGAYWTRRRSRSRHSFCRVPSIARSHTSTVSSCLFCTMTVLSCSSSARCRDRNSSRTLNAARIPRSIPISASSAQAVNCNSPNRGFSSAHRREDLPFFARNYSAYSDGGAGGCYANSSIDFDS